MIPDEKLSSVPVVAALLGARAGNVSEYLDKEDGPLYLSDTDYGLFAQAWEAQLDPLGIVMRAGNYSNFTAFEKTNLTEVSFTFDQNGRYAIIAVWRGYAVLYWYDPVAMAYSELNLGNKIVSPKLSLDDKRMSQTDNSDIILGYMRGTNLCYRQQRDRFLIERVLKTGVNGKLKKIGMSRNLRFQFQVI